MSELIIFKLEKEEFSIAETLSCEEAIFSISPSICGNVAAIQVDWEFLKKNNFNLKCRFLGVLILSRFNDKLIQWQK